MAIIFIYMIIQSLIYIKNKNLYYTYFYMDEKTI